MLRTMKDFWDRWTMKKRRKLRMQASLARERKLRRSEEARALRALQYRQRKVPSKKPQYVANKIKDIRERLLEID
jgi:hypothetical protein